MPRSRPEVLPVRHPRSRISSGLIVATLCLMPARHSGHDAAMSGSPDEAGWLHQVTTALARAEYEATQTADGLQAPNRAQEFRTFFRDGGVELGPRRAPDEAATWRFGWQTARFGRPGSLRAVETANPEASGARVTYRRAELDEWYENRADGLEQGFTVHERPGGEGPLCVTGDLSGDLRLEPRAEDGAVDLLDAHGALVLRYGELHVWDASGRELPARLGMVDEELAILVEDDGARYPLTIDPLLTSPGWTAEPNQVDAYFGHSVATAGDVNGDGYSDVIVGAYLYDGGQADEGRAFVYHGSASGLATAPAWFAEGNQVGAVFGSSVATAGDVDGDGYSDVIVGAYSYDNGESNEGQAFVYHGTASGLEVSHSWTADSDQAGARFGHAVAPAGDVNDDGFSDVIVGAYLYDNGQAEEGRAFVYHGSASGLAAGAAWTAEPNQSGALFGYSVGTAGDVNGDGFSDVIIGIQSLDLGQPDEGGAYVYHGSSTGLGAAQAWSADSDQIEANLGTSVSTAGDVNGDGYSDVIVGAELYDNGEAGEGRVWVYHGSATGLGVTWAWFAESNQASAHFGGAVSTAGDVNGDGYADVIIGADLFDNGQAEEGRAFVYHGSATGLGSVAVWTAESDQVDARLGNSVATAGDVNGDGLSDVIVGARTYENGHDNEGRAFVFHGAAAGLSASEGWTAESNHAHAFLGNSIAGAGDVNGDGYADVIVGAYVYDNGQIDEGLAVVYHGSASGLTSTPAWWTEPNWAGATFGSAVASAGDVNGDGYSDVIVGARNYSSGQSSEGAAFVYLGSASGLSASHAWSSESNQAGAGLGDAVACAGDVNGDGYSDVIVGADLYNNGQPGEGRASVFHGSAGGLETDPAWSAESNQFDAFMGSAVSTAGDVNGDGFSDVIVGAHGYSNGQTSEGRAFVFLGSAAGLANEPTWTAESNQLGADFGRAVAAGDVNDDGYSDVLVGCPGWGNGEVREGRVYAFHGGPGGVVATPAWSWESNQAGADAGDALASAGDVNGDGYADLIVGAHQYDGGRHSEGKVWVFHGSATGLGPGAAWTAESEQIDARFGSAVAGAGDTNGDGHSDVIVSARGYDDGEENEGKIFLYYGNGGPARRPYARQQRPDGTTPIAPLGRSDSETQFRIRAAMLSIYGRTGLQMESEVKPLGVLFDGLGTVQGSFTDVGTDGVVSYNRLVSGLTAATQYHWRVRPRYDMTKIPFQRNGPWVHMPWNGWNEADLRTAGDLPVGVVEDLGPAVDGGFELFSAGANPARGRCEVRLVLRRASMVDADVADVAGRRIAVLVESGEYAAGSHELVWDGRDVSGSPAAVGVYFLRVRSDSDLRVWKAVLTR